MSIRMSRATFLRAAAGAGLGAFVASGCGSEQNNRGGAGSVEGSHIILQTITALEPNFKKFAEAYTKQFPDRTVEVRATTDSPPDYAQQLATARMSDSLPDLMFNVDFLADTLADNNVTLDLAPGISEGKLGSLTIDDFIDRFVGQYRPLGADDQITGLPVSADSSALFVNRTVFDAAGVSELPTASSSWEDLYELARQIHNNSDGTYLGMERPLDNGANRLVYGPVLRAFGATIYDFDTNSTDIGSGAALDGWRLLLDSYGDVSTPYSAKPQSDPAERFDSGNVGMAVMSSANVPGLRGALEGQDWDVVPMPEINGQSTAGGGSYGLSIAQTSPNQDAAFAFLAWFYDSDGGMKVAQEVANAIPPTLEGIKNGAWREQTPPENIAVFAESAQSAELGGRFPGKMQSQVSQALVTAAQQVLLEDRSIDDAYGEAQETINTTLKEESGDS
ncbi:multiple sugar transport system substrate-binding protein [Haloactinopolyspora alba]|uniref:Multiple sugar transport system substrate-binding protein n=1 Tax=Haloactinopolyspora alba TaxID=648780 RepID=A0A2P8E501_9ACTN|nr:extracellular solute-binding protein [Haloactinopolyspora alba]PSL04546.1 multiple sugar transport system substrate-binding protein [Haloactinopolyspora alba]